MRRVLIAAAGCGVLAACQPAAEPPPALPDMTAQCGAERLQSLIGQPEAALKTRDRKGPVRVLRPGMAATMDFRHDRLNVLLDKSGTIIELTCG